MNEQHSAQGQDLGDLVEEYRANSFRQVFHVVLCVAFAAGGLLMLWVAISSGDRLALVGGVGGLFLLIMAGLGLWQIFYLARLRVLLFERGFVHQKGQHRQSFRWEDIETVQLTETEHRDRYGNPAGYTHSFQIRATMGREVVLNDTDIDGGETLGRSIMREMRHGQLKGLLRRALSLEAAGERDAALAAFEQLLRESPYNEIANQATEHIQRLRQNNSDSGPEETAIQGGRP